MSSYFISPASGGLAGGHVCVESGLERVSAFGGGADEDETVVESIRVRGLVQGVGFRPAVWRLALRYGLQGWVANDGEGVKILASASAAALDRFVRALEQEAPPLARIDAIEREPGDATGKFADFRIVESDATPARTGVVPDAVTCAACKAEIFDRAARRYRYPFTNCTHCGPRLSIIESVPYDRAATTLRAFAMCDDCRAEYDNPRDRRFHAQPIACPKCGPQAWLENARGSRLTRGALALLNAEDAPSAAATLLQRGHIVAIKGLGGFQLACDASNEATVARLRRLKRRERKPFALMARDIDVVRRHGAPTDAEVDLLESTAAPIVIIDAAGREVVARGVAPGVRTLGFMLPTTPLHELILRDIDRPIVLTSGNRSDEPQSISNNEARTRLNCIADYYLMHDRDIARRLDDSVVRMAAGKPRLLRRARGYSPSPIALPPGFGETPPLLAMGGELKNTFCLVRNAEAIMSHHIGDLEDPMTHADYRASIESYRRLFQHEPCIVAVDSHPEYLSRKLGADWALEHGLKPVQVQHHHAHIAACLAENGVPLNTPAIVGVALDGLGQGDDGTLWGGEFMLADYRGYRRVGTFRPVAMPGAEQAIHEPWRNTYAHLQAALGWDRFASDYGQLELYRFLASKPRSILDTMIVRGINSPRASSCGRLFDAVAAAVGVCREHAFYEGQAAIELEALVDDWKPASDHERAGYPFLIDRDGESGIRSIDACPMWLALLDDMARGVTPAAIAARFHEGLAAIIVRMIRQVSLAEGASTGSRTVALSGGVFQNRVLLERVSAELEDEGFDVLTHQRVPSNDGGLALGQAAVAAARSIA